MVLGQPYRVEAAAIHDLDALERARIDLFQRPVAAGPAEELQHAYFHGHSALIPAAFTIGHPLSISAFWKNRRRGGFIMFPSRRHCLASVESDQADQCRDTPVPGPMAKPARRRWRSPGGRRSR